MEADDRGGDWGGCRPPGDESCGKALPVAAFAPTLRRASGLKLTIVVQSSLGRIFRRILLSRNGQAPPLGPRAMAFGGLRRERNGIGEALNQPGSRLLSSPTRSPQLHPGPTRCTGQARTDLMGLLLLIEKASASQKPSG
jgi:hypothetical protein